MPYSTHNVEQNFWREKILSEVWKYFILKVAHHQQSHTVHISAHLRQQKAFDVPTWKLKIIVSL
jgi:hypothetical protein